MNDKVINPGQSGGDITKDTRKVVSGWKEMQSANRSDIRKERILKEQQEKVTQEKEANYKPGEEESNAEASMKKMKAHVNKMLKATATTKVFTGNAQLCMTKLSILFNGSETVQPVSNLKILKVEEAGYGVFKISYTHD